MSDSASSVTCTPSCLQEPLHQWCTQRRGSAARALEEGFICIGWTTIGDLSPHETRDKMRAAYEKAFPDKSPGSVTSSYGHPDPLGLEKPYIKVQVKSGASSAGDAQVNQLKGCLNAGEKGILVSLGKFTSDAKAVARSSPDLTLMDAKEFVALFLEHYEQLDPAWRAKYPLKRAFVPFR